MARQISVSNEVYDELSKRKGKKSFSELIKEIIGIDARNEKFMRFAGILKNERKALAELEKLIAEEREANYGRTFDW